MPIFDAAEPGYHWSIDESQAEAERIAAMLDDSAAKLEARGK